MTRPTAILAEDEAPQRQELRVLLGELWPELDVVAECEDGLAALQALEARRPDVAFLDIRMPGVSGLEVARADNLATGSGAEARPAAVIREQVRVAVSADSM